MTDAGHGAWALAPYETLINRFAKTKPMDKFGQEIKKELKKAGVTQEITLEQPPSPEMGDYAFPCFTLAKEMKKSPNDIAQELAKKVSLNRHIKKVDVKGPYLNFFVNKVELASGILGQIAEKGDDFGKPEKQQKKEVMVEFCSPNTNKPLHLGHLRNIFLGESVSRMLNFAGNSVIRANLVNDRGIHICKSMYAYKKWGKEKKPDKKTDHFVGDFYVLYSKKEAESEKYKAECQEMLKKWEDGDAETVKLWKEMNKWAMDGFSETYRQLGIKFDKQYHESEIWTYGKNIVMEGLKKGVLRKNDEGAVYAELEKHGLPNKILLRSDGTSIYMTTDLYLASLKFEEFPKLSKSIYVVGNEQDLHFRQLIKIAELMKYSFAKKMFHLSYGMVNLPEGRMKSREGKVVDADDIIEEMRNLAMDEIMKRHKDISKEEAKKRADGIGLGALRFFMLKSDPARDMVYNPEESISFEGETGPYVQYAHARCCSILRKTPEKPSEWDAGLLKHPKEANLVSLLGKFPEAASQAGESMKPSLISHYLISLAQAFNEFYTECPVIQDDRELMKARLALVSSARQTIKNGLSLLGIEAPQEM